MAAAATTVCFSLREETERRAKKASLMKVDDQLTDKLLRHSLMQEEGCSTS